MLIQLLVNQISTGIDTLIIPIYKVSFGFAAGGSEFKGETINEYSKRNDEEQVQYSLPFGGGSGAGVNIEPVAFLVVSNDSVKLLPIDHDSCVDKLIDYVPDVLNKSGELIKTMKDKNCAIDKLRKKVEDTIEEDDDEFTDDENVKKDLKSTLSGLNQAIGEINKSLVKTNSMCETDKLSVSGALSDTVVTARNLKQFSEKLNKKISSF